MEITYEHPLDGRPKTVVGHDVNGEPCIIVTIEEFTPESYEIFGFLATVTVSAAFISCLCLVDWFAALPDSMHWPVFIAGVVVFGAVIALWLWMTRIRTIVCFTPTELQVKTWRGVKVYDRTLPHQFALRAHDLEEKESRDNQKADFESRKRGRTPEPKHLYCDSKHVLINYVGQRRDIATVYDNNVAEQIVKRLQACDGFIDGMLKGGRGVSTDPIDEWGGSPSELPP